MRSRRHSRLVLVVAALVVCAAGAAVLIADRPDGPSVVPAGGDWSEPPGWSLLWSDEFDGTALDTDVWAPYHSTYGDGNGELQCHTPDNVAVGDDTLRITARRERVRCPNGSVRAFSSGFLGTRDTDTYFPRYGRFEIRAKVPHGQGLWPAFWLRHRDGAEVAEVDVMEYFHAESPGRAKASVHLDGEVASRDLVPFEEPTDEPEWWTWSVEIEPVAEGVQFDFSLETEPGESSGSYHRFVDTAPGWADDHPGEGIWDLAVNLSVGGRWIGDPDGDLGFLPELDRCAQEVDDEGGEPADEAAARAPSSCPAAGIRRAAFPATYEVDFVRVYSREGSLGDRPGA